MKKCLQLPLLFLMFYLIKSSEWNYVKSKQFNLDGDDWKDKFNFCKFSTYNQAPLKLTSNAATIINKGFFCFIDLNKDIPTEITYEDNKNNIVLKPMNQSSSKEKSISKSLLHRSEYFWTNSSQFGI